MGFNSGFKGLTLKHAAENRDVNK